MKREGSETPENVSAEDRERMEKLGREAEGILFAENVAQKIAEGAEEEAGSEIAKEHGKRILRKEANEDVEFAEVEFDSMFASRASAEEIFGKFEKELGWTESKWHAMVGVLRHALNELYYRSRFNTPDERNPHPQGETRDTKERLITIISDDYGAETMREAEPLVNLYLTKAYALIMEHKKGTAGASEEE